jgi:dTDP-4-dehydrorhamnose reductase
MKILVTGAVGRLGSKLVKVLSSSHEVRGIDVEELDIADFPAVKNFVLDYQPQLVINPAAWTNVDGCAQEPEKAILINGLGAQNLSVAAYEIGAAIMQISSNEVFDGKLNRPYYEYDKTNPVNPYGYSKFVGEEAVKTTNPRQYIVRFSWLFSHGGRNFLHAILDNAKAGKPLRVVVDEIANPTYNDDVAVAISNLIEIERYGTYHLCNEGTVSRWEFARYVLDRAGYASTPIEQISRHEWPRPSTPPVYTGLANLAAKSLGITLRHWHEAVDDFLEKEGLLAGQEIG